MGNTIDHKKDVGFNSYMVEEINKGAACLRSSSYSSAKKHFDAALAYAETDLDHASAYNYLSRYFKEKSQVSNRKSCLRKQIGYAEKVYKYTHRRSDAETMSLRLLCNAYEGLYDAGESVLPSLLKWATEGMSYGNTMSSYNQFVSSTVFAALGLGKKEQAKEALIAGMNKRFHSGWDEDFKSNVYPRWVSMMILADAEAEAISYIKKGLERFLLTKEKRSHLYLKMAVCHYNLGQHSDSLAALNKISSEFEAGSHDAHQYAALQAYCYTKLKNYDEAYECFKRALAIGAHELNRELFYNALLVCCVHLVGERHAANSTLKEWNADATDYYNSEDSTVEYGQSLACCIHGLVGLKRYLPPELRGLLEISYINNAFVKLVASVFPESEIQSLRGILNTLGLQFRDGLGWSVHKELAEACFRLSAQCGFDRACERVLRLKYGKIERIAASKWFSIGLQFYEQKALSLAKWCFLKVVNLDPAHRRQSLKYLGEIYSVEKSDSVDKVAAKNVEGYEAFVDDSVVHICAHVERNRLADKAKAIRCFSQASELGCDESFQKQHQLECGEDVEKWFAAGRACYERGEYQRATICFDECFKIDPTHAGSHYFYGLIYQKGQSIPEDAGKALSHFEAAAKKDFEGAVEAYLVLKHDDSKESRSWYDWGRKHENGSPGYEKNLKYANACYQFAKNNLKPSDTPKLRQKINFILKEEEKVAEDLSEALLAELAYSNKQKLLNFDLKKLPEEVERVLSQSDYRDASALFGLAIETGRKGKIVSLVSKSCKNRIQLRQNRLKAFQSDLKRCLDNGLKIMSNPLVYERNTEKFSLCIQSGPRTIKLCQKSSVPVATQNQCIKEYVSLHGLKILRERQELAKIALQKHLAKRLDAMLSILDAEALVLIPRDARGQQNRMEFYINNAMTEAESVSLSQDYTALKKPHNASMHRQVIRALSSDFSKKRKAYEDLKFNGLRDKICTIRQEIENDVMPDSGVLTADDHTEIERRLQAHPIAKVLNAITDEQRSSIDREYKRRQSTIPLPSSATTIYSGRVEELGSTPGATRTLINS